MGADQCGGRQF